MNHKAALKALACVWGIFFGVLSVLYGAVTIATKFGTKGEVFDVVLLAVGFSVWVYIEEAKL